MRYAVFAALMVSSFCLAQTPSPQPPPFSPPTTIPPLAQARYLRFILLNIASLDHSPTAIQTFENELVKQFGLNTAASAALDTAGQALRPLLLQNRQALSAITANKPSLSADDQSAIVNLDIQRETTIFGLIAQVLNSVAPETASRLTSPGRFFTAGAGVAAAGVTNTVTTPQ